LIWIFIFSISIGSLVIPPVTGCVTGPSSPAKDSSKLSAVNVPGSIGIIGVETGSKLVACPPSPVSGAVVTGAAA
jgi:hypothetical protein